VTGPDFDALVDGAEIDPRERERLWRAHEALIAAKPPPVPPASLTRPRASRPRRARSLLLPLAAALALAGAAFAAGWLAHSDTGEVAFTLTLHGTALVPNAAAELDVYEIDPAGNWPMELTVGGLPEGLYEFVLTLDGRPAASCGAFLVRGKTVTRLNAPYRLREYDGWAVIRPGSKQFLLVTDET
jgi:hypothetical protein